MAISDKFSTIFDEIITTHQNNLLLDVVKQAKTAVFDTNKKSHAVLKEKLPFDIADIILEAAKIEKIDLDDSAQAEKFYSEIENNFKNLPTVDITLAFSPTYEQLKKISSWWRKNFNPEILINLKIDKKLVAGAVIGYGGNLKDYTLHQILESYLNKKVAVKDN